MYGRSQDFAFGNPLSADRLQAIASQRGRFAQTTKVLAGVGKGAAALGSIVALPAGAVQTYQGVNETAQGIREGDSHKITSGALNTGSGVALTTSGVAGTVVAAGQLGLAGAGAAARGVEAEEALETSAVVGELADAVEDQVDDLLANGVVAAREVVRGVLLTLLLFLLLLFLRHLLLLFLRLLFLLLLFLRLLLLFY